MKNFRSFVSTLFAAVRPVAIALACALVIFSSATPAFAFGGSSSSPDKGLEQLDGVQNKSEDAISGKIDSNNGTKSVMKNAAEGLNGVQGTANKKDMITRESADGNTIEDGIEDVLEEITP